MKIKYSEEVNLYIKSNIDNKNYAKLLEENPKEILASMDKMKFTTMEVYLFNNTAPSGRGDDIKISKVQLNLPDQAVIKNDCHRTRVRESVLLPDFENILEKLLTYFCYSKNELLL